MTERKKKKSASPAKPSPKGMRIRLAGLRTTQELRAMLHEAVDQLEALGIKNVRGSNLYLTPADEHGTPLTRLADRQRIRDITIKEPYRSAAEEHGL